jgi:hypothetical protein
MFIAACATTPKERCVAAATAATAGVLALQHCRLIAQQYLSSVSSSTFLLEFITSIRA